MDYAKQGLFVVPESTQNVKELILKQVAEYEGMSYLQIEAALVEKLVEDIQFDGSLPSNPTLGKDGKWRALSSLQKCVRRGDLENAYEATIAMVNGGEEYNLWRRMGIIVLEDIGIANLPLAGLVLSLISQKRWRDENGGVFIALYVVEQMVRTVKDRTLCETAFSSNVTPDSEIYRKQWLQKYDVEDLLHKYLHSDMREEVRQLAGIALIGGLREGPRGKEVKSANNKEKVLKELYETELPSLIKFVMETGFRSAGEGLHVAIPMVWEHFMEEPVSVNAMQLPEIEMIGGLPSVAFDKHTLEGKRSFAYFSKACEPVKAWLAEHWEGKNPVNLIEIAVFAMEGGSVLQYHLSYPYQIGILIRSFEAEARMVGCDLYELTELFQLVRDNVDRLNYARKKIVASRAQEVKEKEEA
jgi:hypothetical protein